MQTQKISEKKRAELQKESMELVIKRSGVPKKRIYQNALHAFFAGNIDLLTPEEKKKYESVIL